MAEPAGLLRARAESGIPPDAAAVSRRADFHSSGSMDALSIAMRKKQHSETAVQLSAMMYKHALMFYRSKKNLARDLIVPFVCVGGLLPESTAISPCILLHALIPRATNRRACALLLLPLRACGLASRSGFTRD